VTAADVGDARARLELLDDAVERGQPRRDEVARVARAEEPLRALEQAVVVLVPSDAGAAAERLGDLGLVVDDGGDELEEPREVDGAARGCEADIMIRRGGEPGVNPDDPPVPPAGPRRSAPARPAGRGP
jgi:hypothetical protein